MATKRVQVIGLAVLLFLGGCSFRHSYTRGGPTTAPTLHVNGERVEPTKENFVMAYGPPTFTIEVAEGEICIWRDSVLPRFDDEGHSDFIMGFDKDGDFTPADLDADYGFCRRCGRDLRGRHFDKCPGCGTPLKRDREAR